MVKKDISKKIVYHVAKEYGNIPLTAEEKHFFRNVCAPFLQAGKHWKDVKNKIIKDLDQKYFSGSDIKERYFNYMRSRFKSVRSSKVSNQSKPAGRKLGSKNKNLGSDEEDKFSDDMEIQWAPSRVDTELAFKDEDDLDKNQFTQRVASFAKSTTLLPTTKRGFIQFRKNNKKILKYKSWQRLQQLQKFKRSAIKARLLRNKYKALYEKGNAKLEAANQLLQFYKDDAFKVLALEHKLQVQLNENDVLQQTVERLQSDQEFVRTSSRKAIDNKNKQAQQIEEAYRDHVIKLKTSQLALHEELKLWKDNSYVNSIIDYLISTQYLMIDNDDYASRVAPWLSNFNCYRSENAYQREWTSQNPLQRAVCIVIFANSMFSNPGSRSDDAPDLAVIFAQDLIQCAISLFKIRADFIAHKTDSMDTCFAPFNGWNGWYLAYVSKLLDSSSCSPSMRPYLSSVKDAIGQMRVQDLDEYTSAGFTVPEYPGYLGDAYIYIKPRFLKEASDDPYDGNIHPLLWATKLKQTLDSNEFAVYMRQMHGELLSHDEFEEIVTATYKRANEEEEGICFCGEDFQGKPEMVKPLNCDHWCHVRCLERWVKMENAVCPICRTVVHPLMKKEIGQQQPVEESLQMMFFSQQDSIRDADIAQYRQTASQVVQEEPVIEEPAINPPQQQQEEEEEKGPEMVVRTEMDGQLIIISHRDLTEAERAQQAQEVAEFVAWSNRRMEELENDQENEEDQQ